MNGVVVLTKPEGITSHDAVFRIRKLFGTKKVGHAGTLDPMATGVLPILVGNAVKASQFVCDSEKHYRARMRLGLLTDTEDITGKVKQTDDARPSLEALRQSALSFVGDYLQTPPMYSALKVNGKKLYELARENVEIPREPRRVQIHWIRLSPTEKADEFDVEVSCSKGTYIRTLLVDLAARAGALATMTALKRTYCGGFSIHQALSFSELEAAKEEGKLCDCLVPTCRLFENLREVRLSPFYERLARNGQPIYVSRARIACWTEEERVRLCSQNGAFFALGECVQAREGKAVKVIKQFPENEG